MKKHFYFYSNLLAWGIVLFLIGNYVFGWTIPSQDPPGGNVVLETGATPAGSTGYIQFNDAGNLGADSNLFWDNTNKRLGIGTTSPAQKLHVADNLRVDGAIVASEGTLRDDGGGWVRTYGATGWYSQTYGGGWYMTDTTYLRPYNSKQLLALGGIHMNNTKITNLATPTAATDAATKGYVDNVTTRTIQIKRSDGVWIDVGPVAYSTGLGVEGTDGVSWHISDGFVYRNGVLYVHDQITVSDPRAAGKRIHYEIRTQYCDICQGGRDVINSTISPIVEITVC